MNPNGAVSNPGDFTVFSCTFSISPTGQSFGSSGGTGSVGVTTQTGCSWTAASNDSWVTITSGSSGSGSGTVSYSVSANTSSATRTGTLTIAGQVFTVSQEAQGSGKPNLMPYKPSAWSDKIVVSNFPGRTTDSSSLKTTDSLYVSWAAANMGSADILNRFFISLYVDRKFEASWYVDSCKANYYAHVNDYAIGMLGAGTHTVRIIADSNGDIVESDETDNEYSKTIKVEVENPNEKLSNLSPYQPSGWSDSLVLSTSKGSRVDSSSITTKDDLYINWAVLNNGPVATPRGFSVNLYIDGVLEKTWSNRSPLKSNYYRSIKDYPIGKLVPGDHFLELVIDSNEEISEGDEEDNYYLKIITVEGPFPYLLLPNLRPYQPEGWSDKIVVSTRKRTSTDSPSFTTHDTVYVDWAVINEGEVGTSKGFSVNLYVDGAVKKNWKLRGLKANVHYAVKDYSIGKLSVGFHTLTLVADPEGVIMEWDKGDNEYNKTIQIVEGP